MAHNLPYVSKNGISGIALAAAAMLFTATAVSANPDAGLYDPLPPEGSAFVRFMDDYPDTGSEKASLNGKTLDYMEFKEVSSYFVVPQGSIDAKIGEKQTQFEVESGKFYTVILNDQNQMTVNTDTVNSNRAKAQIHFYNLSSGDLSIKTTDSNVEIIPVTKIHMVGDREINPVKVKLGLYEGDKLIKDLGPVSLERANSYNVVAYDKDNVVWVQSTTNTTR